MEDSDDRSILRSRDIVSFFVDSVGFLAIPSINEPTPEYEENVTHLRVLPSNSVAQIDHTRCMFRIETGHGQRAQIKYGSTVQLIHVPTNFIVIGRNQVDGEYEGSKALQTVQIRRGIEGDELAHKWIVLPRYRLREEGQPVHVGDHIILRNAQYKDLALCMFETERDDYNEHLIGLHGVETSYTKPGWKVMRIHEGSFGNYYDGAEYADVNTNRSNSICGNDYIRITHQEYHGHVICRVDDEKEIQSVVAPLGSVCRKQTAEKDGSHAIFVRPLTAQQPTTQFDFFTAYSTIGVWQIVAVDTDEHGLQSPIRQGMRFRLKHLVSGQYLAIRPTKVGDSKAISDNVYKTSIDTLQQNKQQKGPMASSSAKEQVGFEDEEMPPRSPMQRMTSVAADRSVHTHHQGNKERYRVTVLSAIATNLKNVEWVGRNNPYLVLQFKDFKVDTEVVERAGQSATWSLSQVNKKDDQTYVFEVNGHELSHEMFKVSAMTKHSVFQDSQIGHGTASLEYALTIDSQARFDVTLQLLDKRNKAAGTIVLHVHVEHLKASNDPVSILKSSTTIAPTKPAEESVEAETSRRQTSSKGRNGRLFDDEDLMDVEKESQSGDMFINWSVATLAEPNDYTLFHMLAIDHNADSSFEYSALRYDENVVLESCISRYRLKLSDTPSPAAAEEKSKSSRWWEYRVDQPLLPSPPQGNAVVHADVYRLSKVSLTEVQDSIYACKMLPLARAATVTLQLTPSSNKMYWPLFRHFKNALNSTTLWILGEIENDGVLLAEWAKLGEMAVIDEEEEETDEEVDEDDDYDGAGDDGGVGGESVNRSNGALSRLAQLHQQERNLLRGKAGHTAPSAPAPSYSPWLGRSVSMSQYRMEDSLTADNNQLDHYVKQFVHRFKEQDLPINAKIMRRQCIISDIKLIELCMHFLNAFFILQRGIAITQDKQILEEYDGIPLLVQQCCTAIQLLLHACVFRNAKNALKMLSIHGSFLSLISQTIQGWNPPIETIMTIACQSVTSSNNDPDVSSSLLTDLDEVLMKSITSNDLRQILEQMHDMHMSNYEGAENILRLLTLLCKTGQAKQYFQHILIRFLVTCEEPISDFQTYGQSNAVGAMSRKHNSMLFVTHATAANQWLVKFRTPFSLPPQDPRSSDMFTKQLIEESQCLKSLFTTYNAMSEDDVLDLEECFCLLEDLGFGGPFLYEEIGYLMGSGIWGFLQWWCTRASFFYPSTSVSQNQISPIQALTLMGYSCTPEQFIQEMQRNRIDRETIIQSLRFQGIISSRIPGYNMVMKAEDGPAVAMFEDFLPTAVAPEASEEVDTEAQRQQHRNNVRLQKQRSIFQQKKGISRKLSVMGNNAFNWVTIEEALTPSYVEHRWFRSSLLLLGAICEDRNIYCQRIVSTILPAECILDVLCDSQLSFDDRHIFADLLKSVYVDHDFVFGSRLVPVRPHHLHCGFHETLTNAEISVGKVFNPLSRVKFAGDGFQEGSFLRMQLFNFLTVELANIHLYAENNEEMLYTNALLRLYLTLLRVGFFGEEDFDFYTFRGIELQTGKKTGSKRDSDVEGSSRSRSASLFLFSASGNLMENMTVSNSELLQLTLVRKLEEAMAIHRLEDVANLSNASMNPSNNASEKGSSRGDAESSLPPVAAEGGGALSQAMALVQKAAAGGTGRKSFSNIEDELSRFDSIFSDRLYTSVINHVVGILAELDWMKQMLRVQHLWNQTLPYASRLSVTAYASDVRQYTNLCKVNKVQKMVDTLFVKPSVSLPGLSTTASSSADDQVTEEAFTSAIFTATLHSDVSLQRKCYEVLDQHLNLSQGFIQVLSKTRLHLHPHHAFLHRLLANYCDQLVHYIHHAILNEHYNRPHLIHLVHFLIENIFGLLYDSFLDRINAIGGKENSMYENTINRFDGDRKKVLWHYITSAEILCPPGEDDFFVLDLKKLRVSPKDMKALSEKYHEDRHAWTPVHFQMTQLNHNNHNSNNNAAQWKKSKKVWKVDVTSTFAAMIQRMVRLFRLHADTNNNPRWTLLSPAMQLLYHNAFEFFANILQDSTELANECFPMLVSMLVYFYTDSLSAMQCLHVLIAIVSSRLLYDTSIVKILSTKLCNLPEDISRAGKKQLLNAMLRSQSLVVKQYALDLMTMRFDDYFSMSFMTYFHYLEEELGISSSTMYSAANIDLEAGTQLNDMVWDFIQPMYYTLLNDRAIPAKMVDTLFKAMRIVMSMETVETLVRHSWLSLEVKGYLYFISSKLFSNTAPTNAGVTTSTAPVNEYLQYSNSLLMEELRSLRSYYAISFSDEYLQMFPIGSAENSNLPTVNPSQMVVEMARESPQLRLLSPFITKSLVPLIRHQILSCNVFTESIVNGYIFAELSQVEDKLINKTLSRQVLASIKQDIDIKLSSAIPARVGGGPDNSSSLSSEVITMFMILLNILTDHQALLFHHLFPMSSTARLGHGHVGIEGETWEDHFLQLVWICAALDLFLLTRADFIVNPQTRRRIDLNEFADLRHRIHELLSGMVLLYIAYQSEHHLVDVFQDQVQHQCRALLLPSKDSESSSFGDAESSNPPPAGGSSAGKSKDWKSWFKSSEEEERQQFKDAMDIQRMHSKQHLLSNPIFSFLQQSLQQSSKFIDINGMILFTDPRSPQIKSKNFITRFTNYSTFDLWLKGQGRYLHNLYTYLGDVQYPSSTDYNLIYLLSSLLNHNVEDIRASKLISLNIKMALIELETNRLHGIQHALHTLGGLEMVVKVLGRSYVNKDYHDYIWYYTPLMLKLASEMISYQNTELQHAFIDIVQSNIREQKPPELNCILGLQFLLRKCSSEILSTNLQTSSSPASATSAASASFDAGDVGGGGNANLGSADGGMMLGGEGLGTISKDMDLTRSPTYYQTVSQDEGDGSPMQAKTESGGSPMKSKAKAGNNSGAATGGTRQKTNASKAVSKESTQLKILRASIQLLTFMGLLCNGDNTRAQQFLTGMSAANTGSAGSSSSSGSAESGRSVGGSGAGSKGAAANGTINLAQEVSSLTNSIAIRFTEMLSFISYEHFYDKLAPMIYIQKDSKKRRYLAWHHYSKTSFVLLTQYIHTLSVAFDHCISICSVDSVSSILNAITKSPVLLEFFGLMQLHANTKLPNTSSFTLKSSRKIAWKGGDPFSFYRYYVTELEHANLLKSDPEFHRIQHAMQTWLKQSKPTNNVAGSNAAAAASGASSPSKGAKKNKASTVHHSSSLRLQGDFKKVFGVSFNLFINQIRKVEYNCLRLILSCLEFASVEQNIQIVSSYHDGILIQNMDSLFMKLLSYQSSVRDMLAPTTVAYISLIESIGIHYPETNELLDTWDSHCQERGVTPKQIYGSVEIVGVDKRLRRLYFPVPMFVKQYWYYPEVQKCKDKIVLEVNRSSPEEKIQDFLTQMNRIVLVMKRQERLKMLLTYPIHALFGGKSVSLVQQMPTQRAIALILTMALNGYFVFYHTDPNTPPDRANYLKYGTWEPRDIVIYVVQWIQVLLFSAYALRSIFNSTAADSLPDIYKAESTVGKVLMALLKTPIALTYVICDTAWPLMLVALSFFAVRGLYWLYVPLLADIIFQFDAMYFLYLAIARNMVKVGFTLLLAFLCLYFYAIMAYLFIGNQYDLNDRVNCEDPGSCFKLHLDYGLYNAPTWDTDGFIAPDFGFHFPYSNVVSGILGTAYNLTYVILINLVLQAIISGLIIDSFSSMREEKEAVLADIADKCFICSIPRDTFEQAGTSFHTHIKEEHNMWHYAWFKIYLELKDPLSYSSTENYAYRCMQDNQTFVKLIPIKQSLTLHQMEASHVPEEDPNSSNDFDKLQELVQRLQRSQSQLSQSLDGVNRNQKDLEVMMKLNASSVHLHSNGESKKNGLANFGAL